MSPGGEPSMLLRKRAGILMVKPGMPCLDMLARLRAKHTFDCRLLGKL